MQIKKRITICFLMLLSFTSWAKTDFIAVKTLDQWQSVLAISVKSNKPIFISITQSGKAVAEFKTKSLSKYLNKNFIAVLVSQGTEFGATVSGMLSLSSTPALAVLNAQENILSVQQITLNADEILEWAQKAHLLDQNYNSLLVKYQKGELSKLEWVDFLTISYYNLGYSETVKDANSLTTLLNDEDLKNPIYWPFILNFGTNLDHVIFKTITNNKELVEGGKKQFPWKTFYHNSYNLNLTFAINYHDTLRLKKIERLILPLNPDSVNPQKARLTLNQQYFEGTQNWDLYVKYTYLFLEAQPKDSSNLYVTEAKYLYENYSHKLTDSIALKLLKDGIAVHPTFELYFSMAQIKFDKGQITICMDYCEMALEFAKDSKQEKLAKRLYNRAKIYIYMEF